ILRRIKGSARRTGVASRHTSSPAWCALFDVDAHFEQRACRWMGEAVVYRAQQLHFAFTRRAGVGRQLIGHGVRADPRLFIALAASVPERNLVADITADRCSVGVEEGDPR